MSQHLFCSLITEVCREIGLTQPERILQGGGLCLGNVNFLLAYNPSYCPLSLYVYCDYGEVSEVNRSKVYALLLRENIERVKKKLPVFAVSPEDQGVITVHTFPLQYIDAKTLHEQLCYMVDAVKQWQGFRWV